jgi:hypothetical protein
MATLTGNSIASTYKDLLQVSNSNAGVDATLRTVDDGEGTASALSISSAAIQVDNIKIDGNTITSEDTNGNITLTPNGTGDTILNGNVGIGTDSPDRTLEIEGSAPAIHLDSSAGVFIGIDRGSAADVAQITYQTAGSNMWYVGLADSDVSGLDGTEFFIGEGSGGDGDAHLVIDGSGNVGISKTPDTWHGNKRAIQLGDRASLAGDLVGSNSTFLINNAYHDSGSGVWEYQETDGACYFYEDGGQFRFYTAPSGTAETAITFSNRLQIAQDGTFTGSASADISDGRLKENIETIPNALESINKLKGRTFTWKEEADMQEGTKYGLIAQELEEVFPDLVLNHTGIRYEVEPVSEVEAQDAIEAQDVVEWNDKPSEENTKDEIKAWMDSNSLEYLSADSKSELLDKIPSVKQESVEAKEAIEAVEGVEGVYYKSISMSGIIPVLVEAVKELSAKVALLEAK